MLLREDGGVAGGRDVWFMIVGENRVMADIAQLDIMTMRIDHSVDDRFLRHVLGRELVAVLIA
jgi:hypothetical protein